MIELNFIDCNSAWAVHQIHKLNNAYMNQGVPAEGGRGELIKNGRIDASIVACTVTTRLGH